MLLCQLKTTFGFVNGKARFLIFLPQTLIGKSRFQVTMEPPPTPRPPAPKVPSTVSQWRASARGCHALTKNPSKLECLHPGSKVTFKEFLSMRIIRRVSNITEFPDRETEGRAKEMGQGGRSNTDVALIYRNGPVPNRPKAWHVRPSETRSACDSSFGFPGTFPDS